LRDALSGEHLRLSASAVGTQSELNRSGLACGLSRGAVMPVESLIRPAGRRPGHARRARSLETICDRLGGSHESSTIPFFVPAIQGWMILWERCSPGLHPGSPTFQAVGSRRGEFSFTKRSTPHKCPPAGEASRQGRMERTACRRLPSLRHRGSPNPPCVQRHSRFATLRHDAPAHRQLWS